MKNNEYTINLNITLFLGAICGYSQITTLVLISYDR